MRRQEILGDLDEILGDEFEETVGADAGIAIRNLQSQRGYSVGNRRVVANQATKGRSLVLPLDSVTVLAASETRTISAQPQTLFRPERLVVGDIVNFLINDLKVGKNSQFVASGSMPSSVFGAGAFGVRLKMDTCQVSMIIALSVSNTDAGATHRFNGALFGASVE